MSHPTSMSDEEIVSMVLRDQSFFQHIVMRYEEKLFRYVRRLGIRNHEDAQDVLQEIFFKVYRNLNAFDTTLSFSSWIYRIAHNEAISFYRKKQVRPEGHLIDEGDEHLLREMAKEDSSELRFDKRRNAEILAQALSQLERKYYDVLVLRYFEHKEYEEISDILKIPIGSVGTRIYRGKQRLKKLIDDTQVHI